MTKQVVPVDGALQYEPFGFTNCVRYGDVLWLSGISALDTSGHVLADDIESQTRHTFDNIERVLRAGGSSLSHLLQMTSFVVDMPKNGQGYVNTRKATAPRAHLYERDDRRLRAHDPRPPARGAVPCSSVGLSSDG